MKLLAIDTTEETCSAALWEDGLVDEEFEHAARRHNELILVMLDRLLVRAGQELADLDALAFACGPGSFTGIRIAAAVAQGVAFAADLPVVPVSSLQALAQGVARAHAETAVLSAFDARMGEVYWGGFQSDGRGIMRALMPETVCAPADAPPPSGGTWVGAGSGWRSYGDVLSARCPLSGPGYPDAVVRAGDVARLASELYAEGKAVPAERALPVYLRDEVAWVKPSPAQG